MVALPKRSDVIHILTKKLSPFGEDSSIMEYLYSDVLDNLKGVFSRCVLHSESNSMLVMGPRGVGKSTLVKAALNWLETLPSTKDNYVVVKLNGVVHKDDRSALKDITKQLQLENVIGDRVFGSFAENLQFLLESLKSGGDRKEAKSSIFVLDNFEHFTSHKSQTLLYNLFDVAQSQQAPITVIGLCCRLDTVELLEKRVKSRFAHRFLHLKNRLSFESFIEVVRLLLSLDPKQVEKKFAQEWNQDLVERVIPEMEKTLFLLYRLDNKLRYLISNMQLLVRSLTADIKLDPALFHLYVTRSLVDDKKLITLSNLPALQMVILVCMLRLNAIYDGEPFNFELLYKDYLRFVNTTKSSLNASKNIVFRSFENLCDLELAQAVGGVLGGQTRYRLHHLHFCRDLIIAAVKESSNLPTDVAQWISTTLNDKALGI